MSERFRSAIFKSRSLGLLSRIAPNDSFGEIGIFTYQQFYVAGLIFHQGLRVRG